MTECVANIIQVSGCDTGIDTYVSDFTYDENTGLLRITMSNGVTYDVTVISSATISPDAGNQIVNSSGLYVGGSVITLNGVGVNYLDEIVVESNDGTISVSIVDNGTTKNLDLSVVDGHTALTIVPNTAYSFDAGTQTLNLPLPTLVKNAEHNYTYTPNDGVTPAFDIITHPELIVTFDTAAASFNASTQELNIPIPTLVDNGNGTYTYNANDGGAPIVITASSAAITYTEWGFALQGTTQELTDTDQSITSILYRTGALGIGLTDADTVSGILNTSGDDVYFDNLATDNITLFLSINGLQSSVTFEELTNISQFNFKIAGTTVLAIDNNGNMSNDDTLDFVENVVKNTKIIVSENNDNIIWRPIDPYSTAEFSLLI